MFGDFDLGKLNDMMKSIEEKSKQASDEAKAKILEFKAAGGLVSIKASAAGEIVDLNIDESLLGDKNTLQIILMGLLNELIKGLEESRQQLALNAIGDLNSVFKK